MGAMLHTRCSHCDRPQPEAYFRVRDNGTRSTVCLRCENTAHARRRIKDANIELVKQGRRVCIDCRENLPLSDFIDARRTKCIRCTSEQKLAVSPIMANADVTNLLARDFEQDHLEQVAARAKAHGITEERFWNIWTEQKGRCVTCLYQFKSSREAYIDHNHQHCAGSKGCNECVRGLLCNRCNVAAGMLVDDPYTAMRMVHYLLDQHPKRVRLPENRDSWSRQTIR